MEMNRYIPFLGQKIQRDKAAKRPRPIAFAAGTEYNELKHRLLFFYQTMSAAAKPPHKF
jgi:hypothetical protein